MPAVGTMWPILRREGGVEKIDIEGKWVGSKLGVLGDMVTKDANGRYDQAVAVSTNIGAATKIAFLNENIAASVAQDAVCSAQKFDDDILLDLQAVDAAGAAVATTQAMVGDVLEIKRLASGQYAADTATVANPKVEVVALSPRHRVGEVGGYLLCRVLPAARMA